VNNSRKVVRWPNKVFSASILLLCLSACQPAKSVRVVQIQEPEPVASEPSAPEIDEAALTTTFELELRYQRMIADLLYEGVKALSANRLITPPDISAHAYFSRVLAIEPTNALALKGLQDIVAQYLQLADQAGRQGQFDSAQAYLRRAELVDRTHVGIADAWVKLEREMKSNDVVHSINGRELANKSATLMEDLGKIGIQARDSGAFFLITAPSDVQARWIYAQMQSAVAGHRLRGNIELGDSPTVRLIMPTDSDV
jgi:hypothetical protein